MCVEIMWLEGDDRIVRDVVVPPMLPCKRRPIIKRPPPRPTYSDTPLDRYIKEQNDDDEYHWRTHHWDC